MNYDFIWKKIDINGDLILVSKFIYNDPRLKNWNTYDYYDYSEDEYEYDYKYNFKRNYINESGFYINYKDKQLQYLIYKGKNDFNEVKEIYIFNEKCKRYNLGICLYDIILQLNNIKFCNFKIIKDNYFKEEYKNYVLVYNNIFNCIIKTDSYDFEILYDKYFNYTYLKLECNIKTKKFYEFINNFDNTIKNIINNNNNYISIIKNDNYIKIKIKDNTFKTGYYKNNIIFIKYNRLYTIKDKNKWGISLTVDKIKNKE